MAPDQDSQPTFVQGESCAIVDIAIGGATRRFYYRPQTSDEHVVRMTLNERQYELSRLPRFEELVAFVRDHESKGLRPLVVDAGANIGASPLWFLHILPEA